MQTSKSCETLSGTTTKACDAAGRRQYRQLLAATETASPCLQTESNGDNVELVRNIFSNPHRIHFPDSAGVFPYVGGKTRETGASLPLLSFGGTTHLFYPEKGSVILYCSHWLGPNGAYARGAGRHRGVFCRLIKVIFVFGNILLFY